MPTARDTSGGRVMQQMLIPALKGGGYQFSRRVNVGQRPGGGKFVANMVVTDPNGRSILVSMMWQQSSGTAEWKVPFEVMSLANVVESSQGKYVKAYLILGGEGWTLREFYTSGGLRRYMMNIGRVEIISLEDFVARANGGRL